MVLGAPPQGRSIPTQNSSATGTLVITQKGRGPLLIEGGISFFQVYSNGKIVEEKMLGGKLVKDFGHTVRQSTRDGDTVTFSLPPGLYELRGYVRGCDGNCNQLGGPQYECRATFSVRESDSLHAVREQKSSGSCTIKISSKRK